MARRAAPASVELDLPTRRPLAIDHLLTFLAARAIPGVEHWDGAAYHRSLDLPGGHGVVELRPAGGDGGVRARLRLADRSDVAVAIARVRRLLDLEADPVAIDEALGRDVVLAPLVDAVPGLRVPGSVDPFETVVRAVVGQQISVPAARTVAGRIVAAIGSPLAICGGPLTHVFPTPPAVAAASPSILPMPRSRQRTLTDVARRVAAGDLLLDADRDVVVAGLADVPGIGPWTAGYVAMRALGDPDIFLPTDLGVRAGLALVGVDVTRAERWRPWRSYALHHLWTAAASAARSARVRS